MASPAPAAAAGEVPKVAVLVVHGMGQQVRFQTLGQVENGLRRIEHQITGTPPEQQLPATATAVKLGSEVLERLELKLTNPTKPGSTTEVHLYEAYWAPLTEGRVTLRDVMSFLWRGGLNGFRMGFRPFKRWVFGQRRDFGKHRGTSWLLMFALAVVGALVLLNAMVAAAAAAALAPRSAPSWLGPQALQELTLTVAATLVIVTALALLMYFARWKPAFMMACAVLVAGTLAAVGLLARHHLVLEPLWPSDLMARVTTPVAVTVWGVLLLVSTKVRKVLIQYVGDVAAYVSPHHLDRFREIRAQIKGTVCKTGEAVYGALQQNSNAFEYERIAVVGHSLGSIVAFDTLNSLINVDSLSGGALRAAQRTKLLLTFGSPLDKIAFIFAAQSTSDSREALVAACQPLIRDRAFRTFPWVNVFSKNDIISGALDFYDEPTAPAAPAMTVTNIEDPAASIPVVAHTQYWDNDVVFRHLHQAVSS